MSDTTKPTLFATKEQYLAVLADLGLSHTEQSGFIRVEGAKGRRLYIAATKTVRRVDLSGFEMDLKEEITKVPHCGVFGNVKQQMVVGTGPEGDLERVREVLAHMATLPAIEKAPAKPKAPKAKAAKTEGAVPAAPAVDSPEAIKARMELIKKVAAEKGVGVSSKTLALADSQ